MVLYRYDSGFVGLIRLLSTVHGPTCCACVSSWISHRGRLLSEKSIFPHVRHRATVVIITKIEPTADTRQSACDVWRFFCLTSRLLYIVVGFVCVKIISRLSVSGLCNKNEKKKHSKLKTVHVRRETNGIYLSRRVT